MRRRIKDGKFVRKLYKHEIPIFRFNESCCAAKSGSKNQTKSLEQLVELTKKYYVQKKAEQLKDKLDKRKNIVSLTNDGITLAKNIRTLMKKAEDEVMSVFTPNERLEALHAVRSYADKLEAL